MISLPFRRSRRQATIDALYGTIVAQARAPAFYRSFGVPDTVAARIDMIMMHVVLVLRRLRDLPAGNVLRQQIFDRFCEDMDDNLREMGVGDLAVPKEMRRVGEAFYGRAKAYEAALADVDGSMLAAAIARNVFADKANSAHALGAARLAAYMRETAARLGAQSIEALVRAELDFPDPDSVIQPETQR
jgi:cytochrome b pre-mRNA-processing protein 3